MPHHPAAAALPRTSPSFAAHVPSVVPSRQREGPCTVKLQRIYMVLSRGGAVRYRNERRALFLGPLEKLGKVATSRPMDTYVTMYTLQG